TKAAAEDGVIFAGAVGGGYVFPEFLPAYDAVASLCKLLELLAPMDRPLSELVSELPASTLVHRQLPCPWSLKGTVMRVLTERLRDRKLDLLDGIKVIDDRGWAQVLPTPTSRSFTSTPRGGPARSRPSWRPSSTRLSRRSCRQKGRRPESQAQVDPSARGCVR